MKTAYEKFLSRRICLLSILIMFVMVLPGIRWGTYRCLNLDQMAFRNIDPHLHPVSFSKPPFFTYLNYFFVALPTDTLAKPLIYFTGNKGKISEVFSEIALVCARLLQFAFFAALVLCVYFYSREFFGDAGGAAGAILLGTSAGVLPYVIFLTADMSLTAWMAASLLCCGMILRDPSSIKWSLLAGICAGLAVATKYNGLFIAPAIPLAHLLAPGPRPVWSLLRRRAFYIGCFAVPIFFIVGNPYAILDFHGFWRDFYYNYRVTPVYPNGNPTPGYLPFLKAFGEIFGPVTAILMIGLFLLSIVTLFLKKSPSLAWRAWLIPFLCFLAYFLKIGAFPRTETRFVFPCIPMALAVIAPGWALLGKKSWLYLSLLAVLAAYGIASGFYVSHLFADDPRQEATAWAQEHFPQKFVLERSGSCPSWQNMESHDIKHFKIPEGYDRNARFTKAFKGDDSMREALAKNAKATGLDWFTKAGQEKRKTSLIAIDTIDFEDSPIRAYYDALKSEGSGFDIVFEASSPVLPKWVYPQRTEFLHNTITVFHLKTDSNLKADK